MNSAPATLRLPAVLIDSTSCISTPAEFQNETFPWAVHTPEASPRCMGVMPKMDYFASAVPTQTALSPELLQKVCEPYIEEMCRKVGANRQVSAGMPIACESLHAICEPHFQDMILAMQQTLQQQAFQHFQQQFSNGNHYMQNQGTSNAYSCFQPGFFSSAPLLGNDEMSTDAGDSCAFASIFSGNSSEGEGLGLMASNSEDSESTSDVERSIMVCKHWKSKGWCRLESKCKFLHPESKRGVSAPGACCGATTNCGINGSMSPLDAIGMDGAVPAMATVRRRKRGGKNRSNRSKLGQFGIDEQDNADL